MICFKSVFRVIQKLMQGFFKGVFSEDDVNSKVTVLASSLHNISRSSRCLAKRCIFDDILWLKVHI